jgi:hypothetical protein
MMHDNVSHNFRKYPSLRNSGGALLLTALLGLSACRATHSVPATVGDLMHNYLVLVAELGERDPDSLDFYIGSDASVELARSHPEKLDSLHRSAVVLREQILQLPESSSFDAARRSLLVAQVDAIALRAEQLLGRNRSFDEESKTLFGVVAPADREAGERKILRARLAALLGNPTNPAQAYSRFDRRFIIPADRVPAEMDAALRQCRDLTLQHMTLPHGEHVQVEYVFHKPWSAFSRYLGNAHSLIQVNMDYPLTVDRLLSLACHEGYPGHHVFNSIRDQTLVRSLHREEFLAQPTFSPQSYVSEAAASYAPTLVLSDAERLRIERDVLFPLAGLKGLDCKHYLEVQRLIAGLHTAEPSIAREYLDGRLEFVRASDALERETLMEHGETTLLYLNEYRTYMLSYTVGSDSVRALVEQGGANDALRWRRYRNLMTNPVVSLPISQ